MVPWLKRTVRVIKRSRQGSSIFWTWTTVKQCKDIQPSKYITFCFENTAVHKSMTIMFNRLNVDINCCSKMLRSVRNTQVFTVKTFLGVLGALKLSELKWLRSVRNTQTIKLKVFRSVGNTQVFTVKHV